MKPFTCFSAASKWAARFAAGYCECLVVSPTNGRRSIAVFQVPRFKSRAQKPDA